jgi:Trk K+ transport system NAD-binding subunit
LGLLGIIALLMKYVLPHLTRRLAHSLELLTLFAIAWAVLLGAGSELLGFSKEMGAFLAGVSLASTAYRDSIGGRLTSLRDFLLLFFFIDLGARLDWSTVGSQVGASLIFSLFVLIGNPLIVLSIMGIMGYRRRTGFLAGLTVAQISEFSLILAALGLSIGQITKETMGLITLVGVTTIFASTYMILYSGRLYQLLSRPLKVFERHDPYREAAIDTHREVGSIDVVMIGLGNFGNGLNEHLLRRGKTILAVDFDPEVLQRCCTLGLSVLYGDMADPEMHEQLPLNQTRWVVSTVRSRELNLALLRHLKNRGYDGKIALTAVNQKEADEYEKAGAHLVFRPFVDAAEQAVDDLTYAMDLLPKHIDWPIAFLEIRIRAGTSVAGSMIKDVPLRSLMGVSILALSRVGRVYYDPGPDFQIYPGDRLIIMGPPGELREAETMLNQFEMAEDLETPDRFEIAEIMLAENSKLAGQTLVDLRFRQKYGVTVIGIRRGEEQITTINPAEQLLAGDCLIIIGKAEVVKNFKSQGPLQ